MDIGVLGALLTEACEREHLDCIELLLQRTPRPRCSVSLRGYYEYLLAVVTINSCPLCSSSPRRIDANLHKEKLTWFLCLRSVATEYS